MRSVDRESLNCPLCGNRWMPHDTFFTVGSPGRETSTWICPNCSYGEMIERDIGIVDNATGIPINVDWVSSDWEWFISVDNDPSLFDGVLGHGRCVSLLYAGDCEYASYHALYEDGSVLYDIWSPYTMEENMHDYPIPREVMDKIRSML